MPITIRDVAKRLNLSITTVSRALDWYDDVAEETRKLVLQTAQEMDYAANRAARLDFAENSKKSKFYFNDLEAAVKEKFPTAKTRDIKKAATELVNTEKLIYFSTGSTTMYGLKGRGQTEDH